MSRSCVCGGSNENCRYCNGTGTTKNGLADALTAHSQRIDAVKVAVEFMEVGRHKNAHRWPERTLVQCPISGCVAQLRPHKVEKHLKKVHSKPQHVASEPPVSLKAEKVQSEHQPQSVQQLIPCPVDGCSVKLKANHIKQHIRKVHHVRLSAIASKARIRTGSVETRTATIARQIVLNSIPDGTPRVSPFGQAPDKNLDATKGYAHAYREHGRFGSHPSHDGFDGEADPD